MSKEVCAGSGPSPHHSKHPGIPLAPSQVSMCLTPPAPTPGRGKVTSAVGSLPSQPHPFAHTASKFQLAEKPIQCLCSTLGETELALPPLSHHRPETDWMKLTPSTHILSRPSFQIHSTIVMVLPAAGVLQLLCPCCICRRHLQ